MRVMTKPAVGALSISKSLLYCVGHISPSRSLVILSVMKSQYRQTCTLGYPGRGLSHSWNNQLGWRDDEGWSIFHLTGNLHSCLFGNVCNTELQLSQAQCECSPKMLQILDRHGVEARELLIAQCRVQYTTKTGLREDDPIKLKVDAYHFACSKTRSWVGLLVKPR